MAKVESVLEKLDKEFHLKKSLLEANCSDEPVTKILESYLNGKEVTLPDYPEIAQHFNKLFRLAGEELSSLANPDSLKEWTLQLFPENRYEIDDKNVSLLRESRLVHSIVRNKEPIKNPAEEILFTSNILLAPPKSPENLKNSKLREFCEKHRGETPQFFYDHPIPLDIAPEANEILYGLRQLEESMSQEEGEVTVDVALSVSPTHPYLNEIVHEYLGDLLAPYDFPHLNVYLFREEDTIALIDAFAPQDPSLVKEVFGVTGMYGRHYSFLKALVAIWHLVDSKKRATFKIDLDQVFVQDALKKATGKSALEHFTNDLWGAVAKNSKGESVELGMLAGALVNEKDLDLNESQSLYTIDIPLPKEEVTLEDSILNKGRVMYLSSVAEMGMRYKERDDCLVRYHVTGGTNGILLESLKRFRPFTPTFIGRAEDQSYLISVFDQAVEGRKLRYYHEDGLIMRHDKAAFIADVEEDFAASRLVGDLERILLFSHYVNDIISENDIKESMAPFTSCFISEIPKTIVLLYGLVQSYKSLINGNKKESLELLSEGARRLGLVLDRIERGEYASTFAREQRAWNDFYDTALSFKGDKESLRKIIDSCCVSQRES